MDKWIAMHNSCLDHEGKVIPQFWRKRNGYGIERETEYLTKNKDESTNSNKVKEQRKTIT